MHNFTIKLSEKDFQHNFNETFIKQKLIRRKYNKKVKIILKRKKDNTWFNRTQRNTLVKKRKKKE